MTRWFRMYDDVLDDPKVQRLSPELFKTWVNLLCLASRNDGSLPSVDDTAFALRCDIATLNEWLDELIACGLVDEQGDNLSPHNWNARQFKSDKDATAAERQARKRARDKSSGHGNVTRDITPPRTEAETEAETDTDRASSGSVAPRGRATPNDYPALETLLRKAAGAESNPAAGLLVVGPVIACIEAGADLEADVLPAVRSLTARGHRWQSWKYAQGAIMDAFKARTAEPPEGRARGSPATRTPTAAEQSRKLRDAIERAEHEQREREANRPAYPVLAVVSGHG